jgi:hypothetical protein
MVRKMWVYDPQSGGKKIPDAIKPRLGQRILDHAEKHYAGKYSRIDIRFWGQFCYIDAYTDPYVAAGYDPPLHGEARQHALNAAGHIHVTIPHYMGKPKKNT